MRTTSVAMRVRLHFLSPESRRVRARKPVSLYDLNEGQVFGIANHCSHSKGRQLWSNVETWTPDVISMRCFGATNKVHGLELCGYYSIVSNNGIQVLVMTSLCIVYRPLWICCQFCIAISGRKLARCCRGHAARCMPVESCGLQHGGSRACVETGPVRDCADSPKPWG
jgi:hypothetical protein